MSVFRNPQQVTIPYEQDRDQRRVGAVPLISVADRTFVTRRASPIRWEQPVRVAAERVAAEAALTDPAAAEAITRADPAELLIVGYADEDDLPILAVRSRRPALAFARLRAHR